MLELNYFQETIFDLEYADDIAVLSHNAQAIQHVLDSLLI